MAENYQALTTQIKEELAPETVSIIEQAKAFVVDNDEAYQEGITIGKSINARIKLVQEKYGPMKKATDAAHKIVCAGERELMDKLKPAKESLRKKLGAYSLEKERKAKAEEEKRLAEARKKAEEEALERARELEESGAKEAAEDALNEGCDPTMRPAPAPIETAPKVSGTAVRTSWKFRVVDPSKVPDKYKTIDEKLIRKDVNTWGNEITIGGVEIYPERDVNFRG